MIVLIIPFTWLFVYHLRLQVLGYGIIKLILEFINMISLAAIYWKYGHPKVKHFEHFREILTGFGNQLKTYLIILIGWYGEYIGFELNTILLGFLHDDYLMASWVSVQNVSCITWCIGFGMANTTRTITGHYIGDRKIQKARLYSRYCQLLSFTVSLIMFIVIITCRYSICYIFTKVPQVEKYLLYMLIFSAFNAIPEIMMGINGTLMRIIGKAGLASIINTIDQIILWDGCTAIFIYVSRISGTSVMYGAIISIYITFILNIYIQARFDWNTIKDLHIDSDVEEVLNALHELPPTKKSIDHQRKLSNQGLVRRNSLLNKEVFDKL